MIEDGNKYCRQKVACLYFSDLQHIKPYAHYKHRADKRHLSNDRIAYKSGYGYGKNSYQALV